MKLKISFVVTLFFFLSCCINKRRENNLLKKSQISVDSICVKNSSGAIDFARKELEAQYSKQFTDKDIFEAEKFGDSIWIVQRVVPKNMDGGVFIIKFRIRDCKILSMYAGK